MRYCEMYASDEVPRGRCVYRKWSVVNLGQRYFSCGSRYHEKDGTILSEKHCQPIFFGGPSQRHDIMRLAILTSGPTQNRLGTSKSSTIFNPLATTPIHVKYRRC